MNMFLKLLGEPAIEGRPLSQTPAGLLVCLLVTLVLAGVMMGVYRLCHDALTYQRKFNVTLMMLAMASTVLLALIQNNPGFSLGALGALSICRIRANTRDPRDLGFVFWSLSIGIASAVGAFAVGLIGTVVMSIVMLVVDRMGRRKKDVLTMIVRGQKEQMMRVRAVFDQMPGSTIQSANVFPDSFEMVYELNIKQAEEEKLLLIFNSMEGIDGVNILAPETQVA